MRRAKLGVSKGKKRTDVCQTCQKFDAHVRQQIDALLSVTELVLAELCDKYFMYETYTDIKQYGYTDKNYFDRTSTPEYIKGLLVS